MKMKTTFRTGLIITLLTLAGCASGPGGGIYVPVGGEPAKAPEPPRTSPGADEAPVWRKSEQPAEAPPEQEPPRTSSPSYSETGEGLSASALSLVHEADGLLKQGDTSGAIARLERAQRIAPRSAEVYFKLSEAYVASNQLGSAEQFTLKGLSLAGNNTQLQRAGWLLLADIRRARGNVAGADQAEARAGAL